jgi:hypothetical protein
MSLCVLHLLCCVGSGVILQKGDICTCWHFDRLITSAMQQVSPGTLERPACTNAAHYEPVSLFSATLTSIHLLSPSLQGNERRLTGKHETSSMHILHSLQAYLCSYRH